MSRLEEHIKSTENMLRALDAYLRWLSRTATHETGIEETAEQLDTVRAAAQAFVKSTRATKSLARDIAARRDANASSAPQSSEVVGEGAITTLAVMSNLLSVLDTQEDSLKQWQDTLARRREVILEYTQGVGQMGSKTSSITKGEQIT